MEEVIRRFDNTIVGIVKHFSNGDKEVRAFPSQRILGTYKASDNTTRDFMQRILAFGDVAVALLYARPEDF